MLMFKHCFVLNVLMLVTEFLHQATELEQKMINTEAGSFLLLSIFLVAIPTSV
jgi:hypothetical protein